MTTVAVSRQSPSPDPCSYVCMSVRVQDPPWLVAVSQSCDLTNHYQLEPRSLQDVLEQDRLALTQMTQPAVSADSDSAGVAGTGPAEMGRLL